MKLINSVFAVGTLLLLTACGDEKEKDKAVTTINENGEEVLQESEFLAVKDADKPFSIGNQDYQIKDVSYEDGLVSIDIDVQNNSKEKLVLSPSNFELSVGESEIEIKGKKLVQDMIQTPIVTDKQNFEGVELKSKKNASIKLAFNATTEEAETLKIRTVNDETGALAEIEIDLEDTKPKSKEKADK